MSIQTVAARAEPGRLRFRTTLLLILPALALLVGVFALPVILFLVRSFTEPTLSIQHYATLFTEPLYMSVIFRTIRVAIAVTLVALLIGYPIAIWISRATPLASSLITLCVLIPLWTSVLVRSYGWILLLSRNGVVSSLAQEVGIIQQPVQMIYNEIAVVVAMAHVLLPFMILPLVNALKGIPKHLGLAANNLGANPWQTFLNVTLPLSVPAVFAGCVMVFVLSLGFYITPALLGGPRTLMIATLISQQATETLNWPFAGAISTVLLTMSLAITFGFRKLLRVNKGGLHV